MNASLPTEPGKTTPTPVMNTSRRELLSLSPVRRGEGRGEGLFDLRFEISDFRSRPLTPALSPVYRGEGVGAPRMTQVFAPPKPSEVFSVARIVAGFDVPVERFRPGNSTSSALTFAHAGTT